MRRITALELRNNLQAHVDEVAGTGEPTMLVIRGKEVAAIVPAGLAEMIDQVIQFDKCEANPDAVKADLLLVIDRALAESKAGQKLSLATLFMQIAEAATTVHQFHSLNEILNKTL